MADAKALTRQGGVIRQIGDTDAIISGDGYQTSGSSDMTLTPGGTNVTLAANKALTLAAGTGAVSFSAGSGTMDTTTGALTVGASSTTVTAGNLIMEDTHQIQLGTGGVDFQMGSSGAATTFTNVTGDFTIDNTNATGSSIMVLGTDTTATDFQVQNNSAAALFTVLGSGQADFSGNVDASGGVDIDADSTALTIGAGGDLSISHDGTNTTATSATGNFTVNNTNATGDTVMKLGDAVGATSFLVTDSGDVNAMSCDSDGNVVIAGNLTVNGTTTTVDSETVLIAANYQTLNQDYTADAAVTGGFIVNYDPTLTTDSFTATPPTATTITTVGSGTFAAGDYIQISGTTNNDGIYRVASHVTTTLTIETTGDDFIQTALDTADTSAGTLTKAAISVLRTGTDGTWETAAGSTGPLSFSDLASTAGITLQQAYDNDADGSDVTLTSNATDGKIIYAGDQDFQFTTSGTLDVNSAADFGGGVTNSAGELLVSGGNMQLNDSIALTFGTGDDLSISHDATDNLITGSNGAIRIDNTSATAGVQIDLGSDTAATQLEVRNNTGTVLFEVEGGGDIVASNGTLDIPSGTSLLVGSVALTTANFTAANLDTLLDGSNADALHVHAGGSSEDVRTTGWTETEVIANGQIAAITGNDSVSLGDATSASGDTAIVGVSESDGEVTHIGLASPQFIAGLSGHGAGNRIYASKTAGRVTTDVSGFSAGDTVVSLGYIRSNSGLSATTLADETTACIILMGEPTVL